LTDRPTDDPGSWRLNTFRVSPGALDAPEVDIEGPEGHHAVRVVRLSPGDDVRLIDGEGAEAVARVESVDRSSARVTVLDVRLHTRDEGVELAVAQGLLKGRGFDEVVRRCSELGVSEIVPLATQRSVGRVPDGGLDGRLERWEAVALAATKQSRGVFVPRIRPVSTVEALAVDVPGFGASAVAWEEEQGRGLEECVAGRSSDRLLLVVGPEGGLEAAEVDSLVRAGAVSVGLGRRVLKADWAAAAASAVISGLVGGLLP
jgi:16S rRNA (uracil1498-N3)-methyltransferase